MTNDVLWCKEWVHWRKCWRAAVTAVALSSLCRLNTRTDAARRAGSRRPWRPSRSTWRDWAPSTTPVLRPWRKPTLPERRSCWPFSSRRCAATSATLPSGKCSWRRRCYGWSTPPGALRTRRRHVTSIRGHVMRWMDEVRRCGTLEIQSRFNSSSSIRFDWVCVPFLSVSFRADSIFQLPGWFYLIQVTHSNDNGRLIRRIIYLSVACQL